MTDDVETLPLLDWMECLGEISAEEIRDYARACVEAATVTLRAQVDEWKAIATWEKEQHDRLFKEARALNERAEQLAEALRDATTMLLVDYPATAKRLRAVIAAAQENDDEQND